MSEDATRASSTEQGQPKGQTDAAWTAVLSLSVGIFGLVTTEFLPASLLTPIAQGLGVSAGLAGQAVTVTAVVAGLAAPAVVLCSRNVDRRLVVLLMSALLISSNAVSALATDIWVFFAARVALGVGLGAFWALSAALTMRLVHASLLPRAMAMIFTGVSAASVCAAPLGAYLGDLWGWRATFGAMGGLGLGILAWQVAVVPKMPPVATAEIGTFALLLRRSSVLKGLLTVLLVISAHTAGFTYLRPFLERVTHLDISRVSVVLLVFGVTGFAGNSAGGWSAQRSVAFTISASALLLAAGALVLELFGGSYGAALVGTAAWGIAFGAFPVGVQSWVSRAAHDHAESGGALFVITWQGAIALGAVVGGLLVDEHGPSAAIAFQIAASFAGGIAMLVLGRSPERAS